MSTITKYLSSVFENQKRIGYALLPLLNKGASKEDLAISERNFGFRFNPEIAELYSLHNGTIDTDLPSGKTGIIPIHNWLSLDDSFRSYKEHLEFRELFYNSDNDYTPESNLFPFLSDGAGNYFWVDLNLDSKYYNQIYWTNSFGEEPKYVSSSLTHFFKDIANAYSKNIFFLDDEGYLDCDWDRWRY